jgi:hypothetical protein
VAELFRSDFYVVRHEPIDGYVRVNRLPKPFATVEESVRANEELAAQMRTSAVKRLLFDLSQGPPGRNDEAFEQATESIRREMGQRFDKVAILVKSASGKLQVKRLATRNDNLLVTQNEAEAITFLG